MVWSPVAECHEIHGTAQETFTETDIQASVQLRCPYTMRRLVCQDLLVNRRRWPKFDLGVNSPRCNFAQTSPESGCDTDTTGGIYIYDSAIINVRYSLLTPQPEQLFVETLEPNIEFITQDHFRFRWGAVDGDVLTENESPGKQFPSLSLTRQYFHLDSVPQSIFFDMGGVNAEPYFSVQLNHLFEAETLLLVPPKTSESYQSDGSEGVTMEVRWAYKPQGWNVFWRAKTQEWDRIYDFENDEEPYYNYPLKTFAGVL